MRRTLLAVCGGGAAILALGVLANCVSDPREGEAVTVTPGCTPSDLNASPTSPESTVLAFVNQAQALAMQAQDVETQLMTICNKMDTDLGLATGMTVGSACAPIAARTAAAFHDQPPAVGSAPPAWFNFGYATSCHTDPTAAAACVATCSGPCAVSDCVEGGLSGVCSGTCTGNCILSGTNPCSGECEGSCNPEVNVCNGECIGTCKGPVTSGYCASGCSGTPPIFSPGPFVGVCEGTCTGLCCANGTPAGSSTCNPVNGGLPPPPVPPDGGGTEAGGGDGGADGGSGPPDAGGPEPDAAVANGNCFKDSMGNLLLCRGTCSSGSSGQCAAACAAPTADGGPEFYAGVCQGTCAGNCVTGATGSNAGASGCTGAADGGPPSCDGLCITATGSAGATCAGVCQGQCSGAINNPTCSKLTCQANTECQNACAVAAALTLMCQPPDVVEVEAVTDAALYAELVANGPQLAVQLQRLSTYRNAVSLIAQQTDSDFAAINATGDLVRACIQTGATAVATANTALQAATAADPTTIKQ
jgi:hypothetical protein